MKSSSTTGRTTSSRSILALTAVFLLLWPARTDAPARASTPVPYRPTVTTRSGTINLEAYMTKVLRSSYMTAAQCNSYLKASPLAGLGAVFLQAEKETGIAADLMMAICKQESNLGRHAWSKPPYNNCTNWGISDSGPTSEAKFSSFTACILNTFHWIKDRHLNPANWRYQACLKKNIDPLSLEGIALNYASDPNWAPAVNRIQQEILSFMPEEIAVKQFMVVTGRFNEPVTWSPPDGCPLGIVDRMTLAWTIWKGEKHG